MLGDQAYGDNTALRTGLHDGGQRVRARGRGPDEGVRARDRLRRSRPSGERGRPKSRPGPDREPETIKELIARVAATRSPARSPSATGPTANPSARGLCSYAVRAAHGRQHDLPPPREEWLIAEWPLGKPEPTDYWISNLPADTEPERLARLARLRWKIELDYKQLKGELGLDHYEGRKLDRLAPPHRPGHRRPRVPHPGAPTTQKPRGRPDTPTDGAAPPARLPVLGRPLPNLPPTRRPQPTRPLPPTRVTKQY